MTVLSFTHHPVLSALLLILSASTFLVPNFPLLGPALLLFSFYNCVVAVVVVVLFLVVLCFVFCLLLLLLFRLLVLFSFLASALLYGMTFAFLCVRNPLWIPLGQTLRNFLSHGYRPAVFHRFDRVRRRSFHAEGPKANIIYFLIVIFMSSF